MSFYEALFTSSNMQVPASQIYRATSLEDAIRQHDRCTQIMQQSDPTYTCDLITLHEVTSKSKLKRLEVQSKK